VTVRRQAQEESVSFSDFDVFADEHVGGCWRPLVMARRQAQEESVSFSDFDVFAELRTRWRMLATANDGQTSGAGRKCFFFRFRCFADEHVHCVSRSHKTPLTFWGC
jgi:hypothetical protein